MTEHLYRVNASYTEDDGIELIAWKHRVMRKTPCGCWLDVQGRKRFVLDNSVKRYAHETPEEAMEAFKRRRVRYIRILESRLDLAKRSLALANSGKTLSTDRWGDFTLLGE